MAVHLRVSPGVGPAAAPITVMSPSECSAASDYLVSRAPYEKSGELTVFTNTFLFLIYSS